MTKETYIKNYTKEAKGEYNDTVIVSVPNECYITLKDLLQKDRLVKFLAEHEITLLQSTFSGHKHNVANIGYSEKENMWYGWSHRAMCGFTIGSKVKKGDCAYCAANKEDFEQAAIDFWDMDDDSLDVHIENRTEGGFDVVWTVSQNVPNEKVRGNIDKFHYKYPKKYGHGEWVAQTMKDAKQMAMDVAESVA